MDFLTNPWVIIAIVLSVVIGNIAALKYTANMKFGQTDKKTPPAQDNDKNSSDQNDKDSQ
ncbi:DUF2897 family protein [Vibrio salilacus]|uniref:DUF2897 family protein n=1 Tax=Vibrio salilacus TaxID=1323749 RepID=UPI0015621AD7|nr:DUF2897 family protein [Vibrio salilacus]